MSKYFSDDELKCKCKRCDGGKMDAGFMRLLDSIREEYGAPLRVVSGFRCPSHNRDVGGVRSSLHLKGEAVDLSARDGEQAYKLALIAFAHGVCGIGVGKGFIHLDNRSSPGKLWTY